MAAMVDDYVESLRQRAIVACALERIALVGELGGKLDERSKLLNAGTDVHSMLNQHHELAARHDALQKERLGLGGVADRGRLAENERELRGLVDSIRNTSVHLYLDLKEGSDSAQHTARVSRDRARVQQLLQVTAEELVTGSFASLRHKVTTLTETRAALEEKRQTDRALRESLARVEQEGQRAQQAFVAEVGSCNEVIRDLRTQLRQLREGAAVCRKYRTDTAESQLACDARVRSQRIEDLKAEVAELEAAIRRDEEVLARTAEFLGRSRASTEQELEGWQGRIDTEIPAAQAELQALTAAREQDAAELASYRLMWQAQEKANAEELREKQAAAARKKAYDALALVMNVAQCRIRFYWRLYKRRLDRKRKKPSKGKKGKKGKLGAKKK